ncbi:hypothetical protein ACIQNU_21385 [Streptomyces sp. NPDC091292]|uniref:hypothetical protein n=1 Tax=Streptomyces sp. NPDC091292 TaxID=3365991 RepID=UPI0038183F86
MELERLRPTVVRVTLHPYELAALVSAARYVTETAPEDVPGDSLTQLATLLKDYDTQLRHLGRGAGTVSPPSP